MEQHWKLEHTYASLPEDFYVIQEPTPVANPALVCFNEDLARELSLDFLIQDQEAAVIYLSGNKVPEGAKSIAQAYAGHQFGHFTMLGDGRAVLLGEQVTSKGNRFDIQLKGSGQTPFSRRGDGRASLYSMLREYLISEAMHHLGIPTTRSLSVVSTGEKVNRGPLHDGGVLTRIASSHIRVGTFEYVRAYRPVEELKELLNYTIDRHYPELKDVENLALEILKTLMDKQIDLIVDWLRVGFIHGVMNTDNMSIAGETIDYGPCAFMNAYNPETVFSSIDSQGRYAFGNQSFIAHWNLMIFANALIPLIDENQDKAVELATEVINSFPGKFKTKWYTMMFAKLGLVDPKEEDQKLVDELLRLMELHRADYTQTFAALQENKELETALFKQEDFKKWFEKWNKKRIESGEEESSVALMKKSNPTIIPRNHWVEDALEAAVKGDMNPFNDLLKNLSIPYGNHPEELQFQAVPQDFDTEYQTFCGT